MVNVWHIDMNKNIVMRKLNFANKINANYGTMIWTLTIEVYKPFVLWHNTYMYLCAYIHFFLGVQMSQWLEKRPQ